MFELNLKDLHCISGGDYQMVITTRVPTSMSLWVLLLYAQISSEQITNVESIMNFIEEAQQNGACWNDIQIENVSYTEVG
ncbi:MAG: hypothetical protein JSS07_06030 [Proteobacteria bacterium]|nr:hypothetical protein [Pseudomonadota bacterium]